MMKASMLLMKWTVNKIVQVLPKVIKQNLRASWLVPALLTLNLLTALESCTHLCTMLQLLQLNPTLMKLNGEHKLLCYNHFFFTTMVYM